MGNFQSKTAHFPYTVLEPLLPPDTNANLGFLIGNKEHSADFNLNDLPDEVLSHIISFLPMKGAVRTSVLSRRWSCHSLEIIDAKSLVEADIDYYEPVEPFGHAKYIAAASGALSQIQNVSTLRLHNRVMQALRHFNVPIPLFDKMTCLKIVDWERCFQDSSPGYFLASCAFLETLIFETSRFHRRSPPPLNQYALHESRLGPLLHHLKTIEVCLLDIKQSEVLMEAIEFFWRNGKVLEELKFNNRQGRSEHEEDIARKLMDLPAASNKCRVFFHTLNA